MAKNNRQIGFMTSPHSIHWTGILTYIYHTNQRNVSTDAIHGWYVVQNGLSLGGIGGNPMDYPEDYPLCLVDWTSRVYRLRLSCSNEQ